MKTIHVCDGIIAREASYAARGRIESHTHPWAYLTLVLDGVVDETCERAFSVRSAGDVRIMPAGVPHGSMYGDNGARSFIVEMHAAATADLAACTAVLSNGTSFRSGSAVSGLMQKMYGEFRRGDNLSSLAIDGLLKEVLVAATRADDTSAVELRAQPRWLQQVCHRIHDEFPHAPSLRVLASDAGVNPAHLVRMFRRHYNYAPAEYIAHLRIERACHALRYSASPISEIALNVGFSDQAHFTRRFKSIMNTTPARFRRDAGA